MGVVKGKLTGLERRLREVDEALLEARQGDPAALAERIRGVLDAYDAADAAGRNALLKSVLRRVWYTKPKHSGQASFQLSFDLKTF